MKQITSILFLVASFNCFSNDLHQKLDIAKTLYESGSYNESKEIYLKILDGEFESTELQYNLGNTYYKLGNVPRTILHFEKALKLDSENEDARFNLALMNIKIVDKIEAKESSRSYEKIITLFNQDTLAIIGATGFLALLIFLLLFLKATSSSLKGVLINLSVVSLIIFLVGTTGAILNSRFITNNKQAIVLSPSLTVRSAPNEASSELFVIHEGLKVKVLEIQDGLAKIKIPDGSIGWASLDSFEEI